MTATTQKRFVDATATDSSVYLTSGKPEYRDVEGKDQ